MNGKKTMFVLLLLTFSLAFSATLSSADINDPLLRVSANDVYLTAGAENFVEIVLESTGGYSVFKVEAILSVPASVPGIAVIEYQFVTFNEIRQHENATYHPRIYVDGDMPLGTYPLNLLITYEDEVGTVETHTVNLQLGVIVSRTIKTQARLNVAVEAPHLSAGDENIISIVLENIGEEPIYDIDTNLASTSPYVAILDGNRFIVDSLNTTGRLVHKFTIAVSRNAPLGVYPLTAALSYKDGRGKSYSNTFTLGLNVDTVKVAKQTTIILQNYEADPKTVIPGGTVDLSLTLECVGEEAHDVKVLTSLDPASSLSPLSPTLIAVRDLNPNMTASTRFRLLVDGEAKAGSYPVRITISYLDSYGVQKSTLETAIIDVRSIVDFSFLNAEELMVERGSTFDIQGDLLLIGTESVKFAQIDVLGDSSLDLTSASSSYIGAIDPDSPIPLDLQARASPNASLGTHAVRLNVTYYDTFNRIHGAVLEFPVTVIQTSANSQTQTSAIDNFWILIRRLFGLTP